jgi:AbrB family looped-hinge helix DNA binding protein
MRINSKGQVTIPAKIRERAGLLPNTEVEFTLDGDVVRLSKRGRAKKRPSRGDLAVEGLRGRATIRMTTDQIMALTRGS